MHSHSAWLKEGRVPGSPSITICTHSSLCLAPPPHTHILTHLMLTCPSRARCHMPAPPMGTLSHACPSHGHAVTCLPPPAPMHVSLITPPITHTHMHKLTYSRVCVHTCTHTHMHACMHAHTRTHAHMRARTHTRTHAHTHARTVVCTHMHAHTCTHTHTHMHTHTHQLYFNNKIPNPDHPMPLSHRVATSLSNSSTPSSCSHTLSHTCPSYAHALTCPHAPSHALSCPHVPSLTCPHMPSHALTHPHMPSHALTCPHMPSRALTCPHMPSLAVATWCRSTAAVRGTQSPSICVTCLHIRSAQYMITAAATYRRALLCCAVLLLCCLVILVSCLWGAAGQAVLSLCFLNWGVIRLCSHIYNIFIESQGVCH